MTGILGGLIGSTAGKSLTFLTSQVGSNISASTSIVLPPEVRAGDFCVFFHWTWDNDNDFVNSYPSTPSFTGMGTNAFLYTSGTYLASAGSYRVLTDLTSIVTPSASGGNTDDGYYTALYFRPNFAITSVVSSTPNNQNTSGTPTNQTLTNVGVATPLIAFGYAQTATSTTASFNSGVNSPAFQQEILSAGANSSARIGFTIYNSSPQNHTVGMSDQGTNRLGTWNVRVS